MRLPLRVWLTSDELKSIRRAARAEHRNVGAWVRDLVLREAKDTLTSWRRAV